MSKSAKVARIEAEDEIKKIYYAMVECGMPSWTLIVRRTGYVGAAGIAAIGPEPAKSLLAIHALEHLGYFCQVHKNGSGNASERYTAMITVLADGPIAGAVGPKPADAILKAAVIAYKQKFDCEKAESATK